MTATNICSNFGGFRCRPPLTAQNNVGVIIGLTAQNSVGVQ